MAFNLTPDGILFGTPQDRKFQSTFVAARLQGLKITLEYLWCSWISTVTMQVLSEAVHSDGCRLRHALRDFRDMALAAARVVLYMDIFFPSKTETLN